jgi:hypothetical protein
MDKDSNRRTQIKDFTPTSRRSWWQLHPILLKGLSGVILAGLSIMLKYQSPRLIIAFYADVSQSNREYKAFISVCFSTSEKSPPWKKQLLLLGRQD